MAEINLKVYTSRIKELEAAIYTQKKLMNSYEEVSKLQYPIEPQKEYVTPPEKPLEPKKPAKLSFPVGFFVLSIIMSLVGFFGFITTISNGEKDIITQLVWLFWIVIALLGLYFLWQTLKEIFDSSEAEQRANEKYSIDIMKYPDLLKRYEKDLEKYNEQEKDAIEKYNRELQCYLVELSIYKEKYNKTINQHKLLLSHLESTLTKAYDENIVFPKYRNFVAISAINEYLVSGRCDKLEGPDGAYNLYEMELRQNIVIDQLSCIINNLEQIRNHQFSLYQELCKSNDTINEIISEIRDLKKDTKLNTYFNAVTALVETSPKYYLGVSM